MRSPLAALLFEFFNWEPPPFDNRESKVYLSRKLDRDIVDTHRLKRTVTQVE